jgi:hypothetical protein
VVWDRWNRKHPFEDHPERNLTEVEVEKAMLDPQRQEVFLESRSVHELLARVAARRWLVVAWVDHPAGRYPIHARRVGQAGVQKWRAKWR